MIRLRLTRRGKNQHATFRIVAADHRRAAKGKSVELLGSYDPHTNVVRVNAERTKYWLSVGAQASPTVHNLLVNEKIVDGPKQHAWRKPKKVDAQKQAG